MLRTTRITCKAGPEAQTFLLLNGLSIKEDPVLGDCEAYVRTVGNVGGGDPIPYTLTARSKGKVLRTVEGIYRPIGLGEASEPSIITLTDYAESDCSLERDTVRYGCERASWVIIFSIHTLLIICLQVLRYREVMYGIENAVLDAATYTDLTSRQFRRPIELKKLKLYNSGTLSKTDGVDQNCMYIRYKTRDAPEALRRPRHSPTPLVSGLYPSDTLSSTGAPPCEKCPEDTFSSSGAAFCTADGNEDDRCGRGCDRGR